MKNRFLFLSVLFICFSCKEKSNNNLVMNEIVNDSIPANLSQKAFAEVDSTAVKYSIAVENLDSIRFFKTKNSANYQKKKPKKITDFNEAQKYLKGIVEFNQNKEFTEYQIVKNINFRNGKKLEDKSEENSFIAYFPEEDILLCEGGHSTDVSFNLSNGKLTEETGNPDEIVASPNNKFRLNGHYGGQECFSYFIEQKTKGQFDKIIQLDEEFEKITNHWLCIIGDSFWTDDYTLFLTETNLADENGNPTTKYYKIKLNEK